MQDLHLITTLEELRAISEPTRLAILELCGTPHGATALAEILDVPRTRLYHHINQLEKQGFLTVVETRQVGAMTERLYQVTARRFEPSPELFTSGDDSARVEALLATIFDTTRADLERAIRAGRIDLSGEETTRSVALGRMSIRLKPQRVEELIHRIEELVAEFAGEDEPEGRTYAFMHALYPTVRGTP